MGRFPSVQRGSLTPYIFSAPRSAEAICRIQNLIKVQERARDRLPTGEFGEAWTSHATRAPSSTNTPPEYPPIQIPHQSTHQYKYATRVPSNTNTPPEYPPIQIRHQSTHQYKYPTRVPSSTNTPPEYPPIQIRHQSTLQYKYPTRVPTNASTLCQASTSKR